MRERHLYEGMPELEYSAAGEHSVPFWDVKRKVAGVLMAAAILPAMIHSEWTPESQVQHKRVQQELPYAIPLPESGSLTVAESYAVPGTLDYVDEVLTRDATDEMAVLRKKRAEKAYQDARFDPYLSADLLSGNYMPTYDETMEDSYVVRQQLARKYDVTVHNYLPTLAKFKTLRKENADFDDFLNTSRDFLAKSGTTVRFPDHSRPGEEKLQAPSLTQQNSPAAINAIESITRAFMGMPKELLDISSNNKGVEVVLTDIPAKEKKAGFTYLDTDHNRIFIDVPISNSDVVEHEIGHNLDAALTGGGVAAQNDPAFASLNTKQNVYNKKVAANNAKAFIQDMNKAYPRIWGNENTSYKKRCEVATQESKKAIEESERVEYISEYAGQKTILEDKAETFAPIINAGPFIPQWDMEASFPRIRQKVRLLTERLANYAPGLAGYLVETKYPAPEIFDFNKQYYCDADYRAERQRHSNK